jgi:hypothetical protein
VYVYTALGKEKKRENILRRNYSVRISISKENGLAKNWLENQFAYLPARDISQNFLCRRIFCAIPTLLTPISRLHGEEAYKLDCLKSPRIPHPQLLYPFAVTNLTAEHLH